MKKRPRLRIVVSFRNTRMRLARFTTGSIAVHGALLAAIIVVPAARHRVLPIEDTMVVALAGPIAAQPAPRAVSPAPPAAKAAPVPAPAPKEAHTVREVPVPKPKDKLVKIKKEPERAAESPAPAVPPAPPSATSGSPQDAKPASGTGAVTATLGGGDTALGWYGAAVKAALEAVWAKPYLEDAQGIASVVVTFDIARDGTTRNLRILQSSGIPSLDRSAQRAVIEASPLPAVPQTWTEDTIPVTMRFDLSPESH
jgi:protein TonB